MERLVRNSIRCRKCKDEIESEHRHDFRSCGCGAVSVDGGKDYQRWIGEFADIDDTSVWEEEE